MFRKILVGLEGSEASWCAFRRALALSREHRGELWVLSVEEHLPRYAATVGEVQDAQEHEQAYFGRIQGRGSSRKNRASSCTARPWRGTRPSGSSSERARADST